MEKIKGKITEKLGDISLSELSKQTNVSKSAISKFVNGETEIQFHHIFSIVNALFPDEVLELMEEFSRSCERSDNIKASIEFAAFNRLDGLVDDLIGSNTDNRSISLYSVPYVIFRKWNKKEITAIELYKEANALVKSKSPEVTSFSRLLEIYSFYHQRKYQFVLELTLLLEDEIKGIRNEYIRRSYLIRYYDLMSYGHYACDNLKECRQYGTNTLQLTGYDSVISGRITFLLGTTYFFEDYGKASLYLEKSIRIFRKLGRADDLEQIERNAFPFLRNYWGKKGDIDNYPLKEKAHYYARIGNKEVAIELLDEVEKEGETAFYKYYRGIATDDIEFLYQSLADFVSEGDYFYAKLPKDALLERGERETAVNLAFSRKGD